MDPRYRKLRPVKLRYRKLNGLRLRLIAERITGKPEVIEQAWLVRVIGHQVVFEIMAD